MTERPTPPDRADAISAICRLAGLRRVTISRNAQRGMDRLDYDVDDVQEILADCEVNECEEDEPAKFLETHHMYMFRICLEEELPLYVKVSLDIATLDAAELASFKLYGSPE